MQTKRTWKSVTAFVLTLSLLVGMLSVIGALPKVTATGTEDPVKFTARFTDLREFLTEKGVTQNDYATAYTPMSDTTSVDGYINTWMRERFASLSNSSQTNKRVSATRAWFSQGSYLLTGADAYNGNNQWLVAGGSIHYKKVDSTSASGDVMLRHLDMLVPQYNGTAVRLQNFEAKLDFVMQDDGRRGGLVFNFHETDAGKVLSDQWYQNTHTGNTLVIGNGAGYRTTGTEGWAFHAYKTDVVSTHYFSATTVDSTVSTQAGDKAADGERFDTAKYTAGTRYVLTVTVKNNSATFLLQDKSGNTVAELTKAYTTTAGYLSIGFSNRNVYLYNFEITELNESGMAVDYGTYHDAGSASGEDGDVFTAGFSDLPDAHWDATNAVYKYAGEDNVYTITDTTTAVTLTGDTATYAFDANDKALVEYLNAKFDFYLSAPNGNLYKLSYPYTGSNDVFTDANGYVANWNLHNGQWLYATYGKYVANELFRKIMTVVPQIDGEPLHVRDFEAEFDYTIGVQSGGAGVALSFRSADVARVSNKSSYAGSEYTDTVALVFNRIRLGIYDGKAAEYNTADFNSSDNGVNLQNVGSGVYTAHVSVRVVGNKMTLKVTSVDGATVYYPETTTTLSRNEGGYLYFSTLNGDSGFGNIKITPIKAENMDAPTGLIGAAGCITGLDAGMQYEYKLDTATEWTTQPAGSTKITGLAAGTYNVRFAESGYYAASNATTVTVRASNLDNNYSDGVTRFEADFSDLSKMVTGGSFDADGYYTPTENDTAINDYIDEKFGLFYNNQAVYTARTYLGQSSKPTLENDAYDSYWRIGVDGTLARFSTNTGNEMLRKNEVLTVKAPNGNYADLENFEVEYVIHDEWYQKGAVTLSFRSATTGQVVTKYGAMHTEQQFVTVGIDGNGTGISIAGDITKNPDNRDAQYFNLDTPIAALTGIAEYKVTVTVVGTALTVKITDPNNNNKILWDNTDDPATLTRTGGGYMSFALSNSKMKALKSIVITQLDDNGTPINFGTDTRAPANYYDPENTVYYDFSDASQMGDFDTWFLPALSPRRQSLISTTGNTQTSAWEIKNGALYYKESSLYHERSEIKEGFTLNGVEWKDTALDAHGNMGIAVLKTKEYTNFIASFDFTGHTFWTQIGFGAKNTEDGVYWTTMDGGYNFALEYDGGMGAVNFRYQIEAGDNVKRVPQCFDYDGTGIHHIDLIVSDGTAYLSLDGQEFVTMALPSDYDGGYIYIPLSPRKNADGTITSVCIDNLKVTDLDAKEIVITDIYDDDYETLEINRANGEVISFPQLGYGIDEEGYEYPLHLSFSNDDYRSYKDGTFDFKIGVKLHNMRISNSYDGVFPVKNNINGDYDTATSRKYYFDHVNDFLDFDAYYAEESVKEGYWTAAGDPKPNDYWSSYDGELVKANAVTDKWKVNPDGTVSNASYSKTTSSGHVARLHNVSTLILKDTNLKNFRVEVDVKWTEEPNGWYNYLIFGVQDPSAMHSKLQKNAGALSTGYSTVLVSDEHTSKGGVWAYLEQEGYFNLIGNLQGSQQTTRITQIESGDEYKANFSPTTGHMKKGEWYHMVIEVYDGIMTMQVDDTMKFYFYISDEVYGGLVGIGNHSQYTCFDNFQITALDTAGEDIPLKDADYGWAADGDIGVPEYFGWNTTKEKWLFDWTKKHFE